MRTVLRVLLFITVLMLSVESMFALDERQPLRTVSNRILGKFAALRTAQFSDLILHLASDNLFDVFGDESVVTFDQLPRNSAIQPLDVNVRKVKTGPGVIDLRDAKATRTIAGKIQLSKNADWSKVNFSGVTLSIDTISMVSHGHYTIMFRYTITQPDKVKLPLLFQPVFDGSAADSLCYAMYSHKKGLADELPGYITLVYSGSNTPLKCATDNIGIKIYDGDVKELVTISVPMKFEFTKRYVDITRDNIRDYLALPGKSKMSMTVVGNEPDTLQTLSGQYLMEPALLLCKTSDGNFAKALVSLATGTNNIRHLAFWDTRCYAKDQAVFNATPFMPAGFDSNIEYIQQFGNGGYIFNSNNFDFDLNGGNPVAGDGDITLQTSGGANSATLISHPLARFAY